MVFPWQNLDYVADGDVVSLLFVGYNAIPVDDDQQLVGIVSVPPSRGSLAEVDNAAAEPVAVSVAQQGLSGTAYFAAGPAGNRLGGAQGYVFDVGDAYYAHDATS